MVSKLWEKNEKNKSDGLKLWFDPQLLNWIHRFIEAFKNQHFCQFTQISDVVITGCVAGISVLCCLLCSAALWDPQVLTEVSKWLTSPQQTFQKFKWNAAYIAACIWRSLIACESARSSTRTATRVCSLIRFNPSFILHWVHLSFLTEISWWMKVSMHCYSL